MPFRPLMSIAVGVSMGVKPTLSSRAASRSPSSDRPRCHGCPARWQA